MASELDIIPTDDQSQKVDDLHASQEFAAKRAPEDAAGTFNYAKAAGLSFETAEKQKTLVPLPRPSWGALVKDHPVLSQYLADPGFGSAAQDDVHNLSTIERLFGGWDEMAWMSKRAVQDDSRNQELAAIGRAQKDGTVSFAQLARAEELEREASEPQPPIGFVPGIVPAVAGALPGLARAVPTAAAYGAAGTLGGALLTRNDKLGLAAGAGMAGAGFVAGMALDTARTEQGLSYREYVKMGADPASASVAADLVALANGGLQAIPAEKVLNVVPGLRQILAGKATRDIMRQLIGSNTGRAVLARFAGRVAESGLLMALIGSSQELIKEVGGIAATGGDMIPSEMGGSVSDWNPEAGRTKEGGANGISLSRIGNAGLGGLQQGLGFGIAHSALPAFAEKREVELGENRSTMFKILAGASAESKLRERMPAEFKAYVNDVIKHHGQIEEVKLPAGKVSELLQKENVDPTVIQEQMPELAKALREHGPNDEIVINTADLATHLAPLAGFESLLPDMRIKDDPTPREAAEQQKEAEKIADKLAKEPGSEEGLGRRKVFDDVLKKLTDAGQDPEVARHDAGLWAAFAKSRGERTKTDPFEYYSKRLLSIGAEMPGGIVLGQRNPNLLVQHNLSADNLRHIEDALGGYLPAPSIGIAKKEHPLSGFGDITLLADPKLIDPASGVPVYGADIYSSRHPQPNFKVNEKGISKLLKEIAPSKDAIGGYVGDIREAVDKYGADGVLRERNIRAVFEHAFLKEQGEKIPEMRRDVPMFNADIAKTETMKKFFAESGREINFSYGEEYHKKLSAAIRAALSEVADKIEDKELGKDILDYQLQHYFDPETGLLNFNNAHKFPDDASKLGKTEVDRYGMEEAVRKKVEEIGTDKFEKWAREKIKESVGEPYIRKFSQSTGDAIRRAYTVDNILREMTKKLARGESNMYGFGWARAEGAKKFRSLEEIKKAESTIIPSAEFEKIKDSLNEEGASIGTKLDQYATYGGGIFSNLDNFVEAVAESYRRGHTLQGELERSGFKGVPPELVTEIKDFADRLRHAPTEYFEAKPQRAVHLREFKAAVIPETTGKDVRAILEKHGLKTYIYKHQWSAERERRENVILSAAEAENVLFQRLTLMRGGEGLSPENMYDGIASGKIDPNDLSREELLSIAEWNDPNGTWSDERAIKQLESEQEILVGEAEKLSPLMTEAKLWDMGSDLYEEPHRSDDVLTYLNEGPQYPPLPKEPLHALAVKYARAQVALEHLREEYGDGLDKEDLISTIKQWVEDNKPLPPEEPSNVRRLPITLKQADRVMLLGQAEAPLRGRGGTAPRADFEARDLQDEGKRVDEDSIRNDYGGSKDAAVYRSYVPFEDLPAPKLAEEMGPEEERGNYSWEDFDTRGTYPPAKIKISKDGKIEILDGNHRLKFWEEAGFTHAPAWVIDERPGAKEALEGGELEQQAQGGDYRGKISFDAARSFFRMTLTGKANLSTFLHESGHAFLEFMRADAEGGDADTQKEIKKIFEWLGVKPGEQPNVEQLEKFARGFESYLMEGKAPAPGLRESFRAFKAWLRLVYRSVASLGVELNDEIRDVMSRMLATDSEIEKAQKSIGMEEPMKKPKEMTKEEYTEYTERFTRAMRNASDAAEAEALKQYGQTIGAHRQAVQEEVTEASKTDPVHNTYEALRNGKRLDGAELPEEVAGKKLDRAAVEATGRKGIKWVGLTAKEGGLDPEVAAPYFGFKSGAEMLEKLDARRSRTKEIKEETDRRVQEMYPNADLAKMTDEALKAVHSNEVGNVLWAEAKAVGANDSESARRIVKDTARRRVAEMTVLEMQPGRFSRAEERYSREWAEAYKKEDFSAAHGAKLAQIMNHEMWKVTQEARDEVNSIRDYLAKFDELPMQKKLTKAGAPYVSAVEKLLGDVELKKVTNKQIERRASLASFLEEIEKEGGEVVIPPEIRSEAALKNWKQMTLEDLRAVRDAVANVEGMARLKNKLFDGQKSRAFHETAVKLSEHIRANRGTDFGEKPGTPQNPGYIGKKLKWLRESRAQKKKMEFIARELDGGETAGFAHELTFQPLADAEANAFKKKEAITDRLLKPFKEMTLKERFALDKMIDFLGTPMRLRDVIAVALNLGNEGNKRKLLDGYLYRGWNEENVTKRIGELLSDKHLDLVQHIWDTVGSMWTEIKGLSERTTGVSPPKVEATKLVINGRELSGGYFPIVYDRERSYKGEQIAQRKGGDLFENNFLKPGVSKGFTETRTKFAAPLLLSLNVIPAHISEVIHYLTHYEPLRAIDRLMAHPEVRKAVTEGLGTEIYNLYRPWLQSIGHGGAVQGNLTMIDGMLRHLRMGANATRLGFRLTNSIMQGFNLLSSVKELGGSIEGTKYLAIGVAKWAEDVSSFRDPFKDLYEQSSEMKTKSKHIEQELISNFDKYTSAFSEFGAMKEKLGHFAMSFMTLAWRTCDAITWYAAREKALDLDHPHPENYADSVVRLAQMGEGMKDKSAVMRGGEGTKIFTYMYSWYSTIYNQLAEVQPRDRGNWAKTGELASRYWWMVLAPTVLMGLSRGKGPEHGKDDPDSWLKYYSGEVALESLKAYGPIAGLFGDALLGEHEAKFAPWISTVLRSVKARAKMMTGTPLSEHEVKDIVDSTGLISKMPSTALWNAYRYVSAVQDGKLEEPIMDLLFRAPGDWK